MALRSRDRRLGPVVSHVRNWPSHCAAHAGSLSCRCVSRRLLLCAIAELRVARGRGSQRVRFLFLCSETQDLAPDQWGADVRFEREEGQGSPA
eukprot:1510203-Rhodomonas_salina.3